MAEVAAKYRHEFDVAHVELVDVVSILEFRLPELFPGFRLIIKPNEEVCDYAISEPQNNRIIVRESVYDSACDGDAFCRFTLAHELGHFLLHSSKGCSLHKSADKYDAAISAMNAVESAETQADMFAAHFLVQPALAFELKGDPVLLSLRAGVPLGSAKSVISAVKRQSFRSLTHQPPKTYAQSERERAEKGKTSPDQIPLL